MVSWPQRETYTRSHPQRENLEVRPGMEPAWGWGVSSVRTLVYLVTKRLKQASKRIPEAGMVSVSHGVGRA